MSNPNGFAVIICSMGCCPGCQNCYGMSLGCHQDPCRCQLPCTCRFADEDIDSHWRDGCQRHDGTEDQRHRLDDEPEFVEFDPDTDGAFVNPCEVCGEIGPCGYDGEGRALIHLTLPEDEA